MPNPSPDWTDPAYLLAGNERQRAAYHALQALGIFETLHAYHPVLVGTLPLDIDVAGSDLDVINEAHDLDAFARLIVAAFGGQEGFRLKRAEHNALPTVVARFRFHQFPVEIFGQPRPVSEQNAFRHMAVEARLLHIGGQDARRAIRQLKAGGLKTEPAFARCFGLKGDPFEALLRLVALDEEALRAAIRARP